MEIFNDDGIRRYVFYITGGSIKTRALEKTIFAWTFKKIAGTGRVCGYGSRALWSSAVHPVQQGFYGFTRYIWMMPGHGYPVSGAVLVLALLLVAGCTSVSVGDVTYANQSLAIDIAHTGEPAEAYVQVTVYRLANLTQEEQEILGTPVSLVPGKNTLYVPVRLDPGSYKLFVYVIQDGDRKTAVIRDITVQSP